MEVIAIYMFLIFWCEVTSWYFFISAAIAVADNFPRVDTSYSMIVIFNLVCVEEKNQQQQQQKKRED